MSRVRKGSHGCRARTRWCERASWGVDPARRRRLARRGGRGRVGRPPAAPAHAAAGAQRDRRRAAHQPRPGAAVGGRAGARCWRGGRYRRRRVRPGDRPAGPARAGGRWPRSAAAVPAAGGGARGQQRRRRAGAGADRAGGRPRGRGQPRRAGGDRRRVPASPTCSPRPAPGCARWAPPTGPRWPTTPPRSARRPAASSRCTRATSWSTASPPARRRRASWPTLGAPVVVDIGCGLLAPPTRCCRTSRTPRPTLRAGAALVTASGDKLLGGPQAGLLLGRRRRGRAAAPAPAGPRAAGGQADPGRAGGDPARPGDRRPGRRCAADPAALRDRAERLAALLRRGRCGRRRGGQRRRRSAAAARPGCALPSVGGERCPSAYAGAAAGRATRRCSAGWSAAAACSTCAACRRDRRRRAAPRGAGRSLRRAGLTMHVVATAGHVDHGKSTLVRALTGMEPDRWAEERRRGMTIDLGFAWTTLPSGAAVAFVDVPGHERFVPTMLAGRRAGAGRAVRGRRRRGLDAAVGRAPGRAGRARRPARAARGDPQRPGRPGAGGGPGAGRGRGDLARRGAGGRGQRRRPAPGWPSCGPRWTGCWPGCRRRTADAPVRLWVDRAFTVRGSGTVVTGTLGAGTLRVGDELELVPGGAAGPGARPAVAGRAGRHGRPGPRGSR